MRKALTLRFFIASCVSILALVNPLAGSEHEPNAVKRLLVCSITQAFRHGSIEVGEQALSEIAAAHPGFEIAVWVQQPQVGKARMAAAQASALQALSPAALRAERIDAVVFLNTSGNLALPDLDGLVDWVEEGHGFITVHAGTDTLKSAPRYTEMIQGVFTTHGPQVSATLHAGDTDHPANAGLGATWHLPQEEIYLFRDHDREKVRTLWHMRHHPNDPEQEGYFPIVWCREVGEGRFFNTALGHREDLWDPKRRNRVNPPEVAEQFRAHLLGGILWTLGLAEGSGEPNPQVK